MIQCYSRPGPEKQGYLPDRERIDHHQHVTNAFPDRGIVETGRLQKPTVQLEPDAGPIPEAVATHKPEPKRRLAGSAELVRGQLELSVSELGPDPPWPNSPLFPCSRWTDRTSDRRPQPRQSAVPEHDVTHFNRYFLRRLGKQRDLYPFPLGARGEHRQDQPDNECGKARASPTTWPRHGSLTVIHDFPYTRFPGGQRVIVTG